MFSMPYRRVAAIVLPHLLCELAAPASGRQRPFGVVMRSEQAAPEPLRAHTPLDAVDTSARRLGLRAGLTIAEAHAFMASLEVRTVSRRQVRGALARVAEAALAFCPTVGLSPPDAVHLDLTGATHLHGGELPLLHELKNHVEQLGHVARVAIAQGPRIAEIVARHGHDLVHVVDPEEDQHHLRSLPVSALPIHDETACWLVRVGVLTIGDLLQLPRDQVTARLGDKAAEVMMLAVGHDPCPLQPYTPPPTLREHASWDEGVHDLSALVFVLGRLTVRLAARLQGRGQALRSMTLTLEHDRSIARLQGQPEEFTTQLEMPAPIDRAEDLLRILRARLEPMDLQAPVLGLRLETTLLVPAPRVQLDLSRDATVSPDALPALLAELSAEIGADRLGTLCLVDSHLPEARSCLRPPVLRPFRHALSLPFSRQGEVTRLLPKPVPLGEPSLCPGAQFVLESLPPLRIEQVQFDHRLTDIAWWTPHPASRDYFLVWVRIAGTGGSAWIYRDRHRGTLQLHGWFD